MRSRTLILLFAVVAFACSLFVVSAHGPSDEKIRLSLPTPFPSPSPSPAASTVNAQQPDDEEVRGAFLTSRPKNTNPNATRRRRPPRKVKVSLGTDKNPLPNPDPNNYVTKGPVPAIALGYTIFMADANGQNVRVEPGHEFHSGDRVRIALEPNIDGYLYVFHIEGDGAPEMLYPDWRLDGGENWIEAHVPIEVPSGSRPFVFDQNPAIEHLYLVVTREPLNAVPTTGDLVNFCAVNKCPWHPSTEMFALVQGATKADVKVVISKMFGQKQSDKEKVATTRGLGLDSSAPEPAVIRMNAATTTPILVAVVDLIHK